MPLQVVYGDSRSPGRARVLADQLRAVADEGTVYLGYPVLATADENVTVDALMVSRAHGLVAFLLADAPRSDDDWVQAKADQDRLYNVLDSTLSKHSALRRQRRLAVGITTITVFPSTVTAPDSFEEDEGIYCALEEVTAEVAELEGIDEELQRAVESALQRVTTIKPVKKRASVHGTTTRGAVLKIIEAGIANLDQWQKAAAIETPQGPQRIRGLAGSGKTVVLALKAAYLHTQHPDWRIAVTYYSRALYQQIEDLVTRFTFEYSNDRPDEEHLQILHSWGSASRAGLYSEMARAAGTTARDFNYARSTYGIEDAFVGVCRELLTIVKQSQPEPIFDAVLIDEAQDLPPEFFQLIYHFTKDPKRIVWGFDELQKLSEAAMPSTDELFGTGPHGESLVSIDNRDNEPKKDIVLQVCYRNTPWALATAHALGIGVYRDGNLLQHFDDPELWADIGYETVHGHLALGSRVTLLRKHNSSPPYFRERVQPDDAVMMLTFDSQAAQDIWIAQEIKKNLTEDELEHEDILIVLPDAYRAKSRAPKLMRALLAQGVASHLVGVSSSTDLVFQRDSIALAHIFRAKGTDLVFQRDSIALAHIFRAKGNEAPMVYVVDAQYAASNENAVTRRNTLFTAITRSRAWVRVVGYGPAMNAIAREIDTVQAKGYRLEFTIPSADELDRMRHLNRDLSGNARTKVQEATAGLKRFLDAFEADEVEFDDIPPAMRTRLMRRLREELEGDDA